MFRIGKRQGDDDARAGAVPLCGLGTDRAAMGFDDPWVVQYLRWIGRIVLDGDFGTSLRFGRPVGELIRERLPATALLAVVALAWSTAVGFVLGTIAAVRRGGFLDFLVRAIALSGQAIPVFWLGLLLIRQFSVELDWLPPYGITPLKDGLGAHLASLLLPALSIALYYTGAMSRLLRASMIEVLGSDYMRTARACGLKPARRLVYALRNALPPFLSMAAMSFGYMFGWAVVVELVFNIPGLSRAMLTAILQRDYPMIQAAVLVVTLVFVLANALADVALRLVNPRIAR